MGIILSEIIWSAFFQSKNVKKNVQGGRQVRVGFVILKTYPYLAPLPLLGVARPETLPLLGAIAPETAA